MTLPISQADRQTLAIEAVADALLSACALRTGPDPDKAVALAHSAIMSVYRRAATEQGRS